MARIVFMGTPDFAVPSLEALANTEHEIIGVFTRPDQPAGRGKRLMSSPTKQFAESRNLRIYQPLSFRKPESVALFRELAPDLAIVSAYGLILPPAVIAVPHRGIVNTHGSLLPRHRGAAPIAAAILAGDSETGVTLMQMEAGLDSGPILAQRAIPIGPNDTAGTLSEKLSRLAAQLLSENLAPILAGEILPQPQDESRATVFRTIKKEQGLIDWSQSVEQIERQVRAYNPWPSAYSFWKGIQLRILRAHPLSVERQEPGRVIRTKEGIGVGTGDGLLLLDEVQLAGKRPLPAEEFVRGQREFVGRKVG